MAQKDLYKTVTPQAIVDAVAAAATTTSSTVDLQGYDSSLFLISLGIDAAVDAGDYWTITMQHSDDDSTYAACAATDVVGDNGRTAITATSGVLATVVTLAAATLICATYIGDKRYVQIVLTETSDTGDIATPLSVVALKGHYKYPPAPVQA